MRSSEEGQATNALTSLSTIRVWVQYSLPLMNCWSTHGFFPDIDIAEIWLYVSLTVLFGRTVISPLEASSMPTLFMIYCFFVLGLSWSTLCTAALLVTLCVSGAGRPRRWVWATKVSFSCSICVVDTSNCMHRRSLLLSSTSLACPSSTADATPEQLTQRSTFSFLTMCSRASI